MKNILVTLSAIAFISTSCQKTVELAALTSEPSVKTVTIPQTPAAGFTKYTILKGQQYCDINSFAKVEYEELKFVVKFDSSAIYRTINPENQADINKLFGFSDNNAQHHQFSARFGWNWDLEQGLCLYGYIYNDGVRSAKLLGSVEIGKEHTCSIKVAGSNYIFTLNGQSVTMPRTSPTAKATGYRLYPYFGGDEFAPHTIGIWIKEL
jgi:hypothetical protein